MLEKMKQLLIKIDHYLPICCIFIWLYITVPYYLTKEMCPDSLLQISQALSGEIGDWHPPFVTFIIQCFLWTNHPEIVIRSIVLLMIMGGILLITNGLKKYNPLFRYFPIILFITIPLASPHFFVENVVFISFKDDLLLGGTFLTLGLILTLPSIHARKYKNVIIATIILMFFLLIAFRHNAILMIPVLSFMLLSFVFPKFTIIKKIIIATLVSISLYGVNHFMTYNIFHAEHQHPERVALQNDIMGICYLQKIRSPLLDSHYGKEYVDSFMNYYKFDTWSENIRFPQYYISHSDTRKISYPPYEDMLTTWKDLIQTYPKSYLYAKLKFSTEYLIDPVLLKKIGFPHIIAPEKSLFKSLISSWFFIPFLITFGYFVYLCCTYIKQKEHLAMTLDDLKVILLGAAFFMYGLIFLFSVACCQRYMAVTYFLIAIVYFILLVEYFPKLSCKILPIVFYCILSLYVVFYLVSISPIYLVRLRTISQEKAITDVRYDLLIGKYPIELSKILPLKNYKGSIYPQCRFPNDMTIWKINGHIFDSFMISKEGVPSNVQNVLDIYSQSYDFGIDSQLSTFAPQKH